MSSCGDVLVLLASSRRSVSQGAEQKTAREKIKNARREEARERIPLIQSCSNLPFIDYGRIYTGIHLRIVGRTGHNGCLPFSKTIRIFRLKVKRNRIFWKIRSEIVKYLHRWSFSFVRNGTAGIYCLYYPSNLFRNARNFQNWGINKQ